MPSFKDPKGRWRWRFTFRGKRYSGTAPRNSNTKAAAERAEKAELARLEGGGFTGKVQTVAEFAVKFLEHQAARTKATTIRAQRMHVTKHIVPYVGRLRLDELTMQHGADLQTKWKTAGAEVRTCNGRLFTLGRMLSLATEWGVIARAPKLERFREPDDSPRFLNEPEVAWLLDAMPPEWRSMAVVALRTGLRIGELRGLQWIDVDLLSRSLRVRRTAPGRKGMDSTDPKGKRERTVPLTPDAVMALEAARKSSAGSIWVWPGKRSRSSVDPKRCRSESWCIDAMVKAVKAAGLEADNKDPVGWHTLRHTYASWLAMRGVPVNALQALLGHASLKQTQRYMHLAPGFVSVAMVASLDVPMMTDATRSARQESGDPRLLTDGSGPESQRERATERSCTSCPSQNQNYANTDNEFDETEHW